MNCNLEWEKLALYANDDLSQQERLGAEAHIARCARCQRVLQEYRESSWALSRTLLEVGAPDLTRRARGTPGRAAYLVTAAGLVVAVMVALSPGVRAGVARLFGWYSVSVKPPVSAGQEHDDSSTVYFEREFASEHTIHVFTHSLDEARAFLGFGVALPPALEGREMLLFREVTDEGDLVMVGLSEPNLGFWARYRPAGDHRVQVTYGSDYQVTTETRVIGGRQALLVWTERISGKRGPVEIWLEDGNWVYELRDNLGSMETLLNLVESMR